MEQPALSLGVYLTRYSKTSRIGEDDERSYHHLPACGLEWLIHQKSGDGVFLSCSGNCR